MRRLRKPQRDKLWTAFWRLTSGTNLGPAKIPGASPSLLTIALM